MFTPYDWQEGMGNRASYIEAKLAHGSPAVAVSLDEGVLVFTYRPQGRKVYEIYDRLIYAGVGQQSDVEALRVAAVEFTHQEGYNRSEQDVTIQRVVAALSASLKRAFGDFSSAPFVARSLFAEVNRTPEEDLYYALDYDGNFQVSRRHTAVAGSEEVRKRLIEQLAQIEAGSSPEKAMQRLQEVWAQAVEPDSDEPTETASDLKPEAVLLERSEARENRFRYLTPEEF